MWDEGPTCDTSGRSAFHSTRTWSSLGAFYFLLLFARSHRNLFDKLASQPAAWLSVAGERSCWGFPFSNSVHGITFRGAKLKLSESAVTSREAPTVKRFDLRWSCYRQSCKWAFKWQEWDAVFFPFLFSVLFYWVWSPSVPGPQPSSELDSTFLSLCASFNSRAKAERLFWTVARLSGWFHVFFIRHFKPCFTCNSTTVAYWGAGSGMKWRQRVWTKMNQWSYGSVLWPVCHANYKTSLRICSPDWMFCTSTVSAFFFWDSSRWSLKHLRIIMWYHTFVFFYFVFVKAVNHLIQRRRIIP